MSPFFLVGAGVEASLLKEKYNALKQHTRSLIFVSEKLPAVSLWPDCAPDKQLPSSLL